MMAVDEGCFHCFDTCYFVGVTKSIQSVFSIFPVISYVYFGAGQDGNVCIVIIVKL